MYLGIAERRGWLAGDARNASCERRTLRRLSARAGSAQQRARETTTAMRDGAARAGRAQRPCAIDTAAGAWHRTCAAAAADGGIYLANGRALPANASYGVAAGGGGQTERRRRLLPKESGGWRRLLLRGKTQTACGALRCL
jgi:hypothetical protein